MSEFSMVAQFIALYTLAAVAIPFPPLFLIVVPWGIALHRQHRAYRLEQRRAYLRSQLR